MTIESIISCLVVDGWRLGSLCQLTPTDWYACVIDDEGFVHTGTGVDPMETILFASLQPRSGRLYDRDRVETPAESTNLDLFALGLLQRPQAIRRRV
jgi:hypothetical protein